MKHSIDWHQATLLDKAISAEKLMRELDELHDKVLKINYELGRYAYQIRKAVNVGLSEFDRDTFLNSSKEKHGEEGGR